MKASLFISDLHLCTSRPAINHIFFAFLKGPATQAEALYVLGDLFEYWAGDDDIADPFNATVIAAFRQLADCGVKLYFMHGNRDFLLGKTFVDACGATLLDDPALIDLYGTPSLLSHGDALCTFDTAYQVFRNEVRATGWKHKFLAQPLIQRKAVIEGLRRESEQQKKAKAFDIMDVSEQAVIALLREYRYPRLIHGHTHRPARHLHQVDGKTCERWVLSDWYETGSYLSCDNNGCVVSSFTSS